MYYYLNDEEKCSLLAALQLLAHARQEGWELPRKIEQMEANQARYPQHAPDELGALMDWILETGLPPWRVSVHGQSAARSRFEHHDLSGRDPLGAEVQDAQGRWWRVIGTERRQLEPERWRVTLERQVAREARHE